MPGRPRFLPAAFALSAALSAGLLLIAATAAQAVTIVSADGPGPPNSIPNNPTGFLIGTSTQTGDEQYLAVGWTQTAGYSNVAITALLSGSFRGDAYLTTALGPGATAANTIAVGSFVIDLDIEERTDVLLLSGLSLGPGTYFLTLAPAPGSGGNWWNEKMTSLVLDPGVTFAGAQRAIAPGIDPGFIPASVFASVLNGNDSFTFAVTGDPAATQVTEPATGLLLGTGLAALAWARRRHAGGGRAALLKGGGP